VLGYVSEYAVGSGRAKCVEDLTTKLVSKYRGVGRIPLLREIRSFAKAAVAPEGFDLDKYKRSFLLSDDPRNEGRYPWSILDIVKEARGEAI
jgi:hypothetical protein